MSMILSPIKSINLLSVSQIPQRPFAVAKAVGIGRRDVVLISPKGIIYSTQVRSNNVAYSFGCNLESTVEGLKRLGVLSKEAADEHNRIHREREEKRDARYAAERFEEHAKTLGLRLTAAQLSAVEKAKGGAE